MADQGEDEVEDMQLSDEENDTASNRMTDDQTNAMLDYMANPAHSDFAAGRLTGCNGSQTRELQGERLAQIVSDLGPPDRSWKQIQGRWSRLKRQAKVYHAKKKQSQKTGNNAAKIKKNIILEKVLKIVGTSHCNGLEMVSEIGVKKISMKKNIKIKPRANKVVYEAPKNNVNDEGTDQDHDVIDLTSSDEPPSKCFSSHAEQPSNLKGCPLPSSSTKTLLDLLGPPKSETSNLPSSSAGNISSPSYTKYSPKNANKGTLLKKAKDAIDENTDEMKNLIELKKKDIKMKGKHYAAMEEMKRKEVELLEMTRNFFEQKEKEENEKKKK